MLFRTLLLMAVFLLGALTGPAAADDGDRPKWGEAGSWEIYVDPRFGNACYAVASLFHGVVMLISVRPDGGLHFVIAHDRLQFAEVGQTYRLKFVFANDATYEEEMEAVALPAAVVLANWMSAAFLSDFMERTIMLVYYRGSLIAPVLLLDTHEAVTRLRICDASAPGTIDPSDPALR